MLALEENKNRQLEVEISRLTREKDEVIEATRIMEVKMNRALYQVKLQQKDKCLEVLSQSHSRFNHLIEVSGCEAFPLELEQALLDPLVRVFTVPEGYNAQNKVGNNNYNL